MPRNTHVGPRACCPATCPCFVHTVTAISARSFTKQELRQERYDLPMALPTLDRPGDFIDGAFRLPAPADAELVIASPADTTDITAIHPVSAEALDAAVDAARRAFPAWRRLGASAR